MFALGCCMSGSQHVLTGWLGRTGHEVRANAAQLLLWEIWGGVRVACRETALQLSGPKEHTEMNWSYCG